MWAERTLQTTPSSPGRGDLFKKTREAPLEMFMSFFSRAHTAEATPALRSQALCNLNFLSHGVVGCVLFSSRDWTEVGHKRTLGSAGVGLGLRHF